MHCLELQHFSSAFAAVVDTNVFVLFQIMPMYVVGLVWHNCNCVGAYYQVQ